MTDQVEGPVAGAEGPANPKTGTDDDDRHKLTSIGGLSALSLDALSSVAYGPETIVLS